MDKTVWSLPPPHSPPRSIHFLQSSARILEEPLCKDRRQKPLQEAALVASPLHRLQALAHVAGKGAFPNLLSLISLLISLRPQDLQSLGDVVFLLNLAPATINSFHLECFLPTTQLILVTAITAGVPLGTESSSHRSAPLLLLLKYFLLALSGFVSFCDYILMTKSLPALSSSKLSHRLLSSLL